MAAISLASCIGTSPRSSPSARRRSRRSRSSARRPRMALGTAAGVSLAYILLPMFFVVWLAFFAQEIPSFPPEGYSLKWFWAVPGNDRFVKGFLLSLQVAVVSTSIGLAIGVPAAVCL